MPDSSRSRVRAGIDRCSGARGYVTLGCAITWPALSTVTADAVYALSVYLAPTGTVTVVMGVLPTPG